MTLMRDESGSVFSLMECPHCGSYAMHAAVKGEPGQVFECARCFARFTDWQ
jgi:DNA-directed RNA polymerase subunit RPC12/RpoP